MAVCAAGAVAVGAAGGLGGLLASKLDIADQLSPLNRTRPVRPHTRYIVLHTTEGKDVGSLNKLVRHGEAHYFVALSGKVYRIIDKAKIAKHAGRSMWEGRSTIDNHSIGIEVSGYHNHDITAAQYEALRELIRQVKSIYGIPDDRVLTHSMVAYGVPNRFHDENHRGRKRCGMIFADPKVRAKLGLKSAPDHDEDVMAGRLKVADKELYQFLFATAKAKPALLAQGDETTPPPPDVDAGLEVASAAEPAVETVEVASSQAPSEPPEGVGDAPVAAGGATDGAPVAVVAANATPRRNPDSAGAAPLAAGGAERGAPASEAVAKPAMPKTKEPPAAPAGEAPAAKPAATPAKKPVATPAKKVPAPAKKPAKTDPATVKMPSEPPFIDSRHTAWQIARERYDSPSTIYEFPDGRRFNGGQIKDWGRIPSGTRVTLGDADDEGAFEGFLEIGKDGNTPRALAGKAYASKTTIYFFPNGMVRTGAELQKGRSYRSLFQKPPKGTRLLVGYVYGGSVKQRRPPAAIAGVKWNYPSTYYRYPDGRILSGDDVNDKSIPVGTLVFYEE